MTSETYRRAIELLEADIDDELVALEPSKGACFGFNPVAKDVWRRLEQPRSFEELREGLLDEYDVNPEQCALELRQLLDDMVAKGLVEETGKVGN